MTPVGELLTTGEAAEHFGVNVATVRRWAKSGHLRHTILPSGQLRFRREDLDESLRHVEPQPKDDASTPLRSISSA